jgi:hypothetical protein
MVSAAIMPAGNGAERIGAKVGRLERLDVLLSVDHPSADFQISRSPALPARHCSSVRGETNQRSAKAFCPSAASLKSFLRAAPRCVAAHGVTRKNLAILPAEICGRAEEKV